MASEIRQLTGKAYFRFGQSAESYLSVMCVSVRGYGLRDPKAQHYILREKLAPKARQPTAARVLSLFNISLGRPTLVPKLSKLT